MTNTAISNSIVERLENALTAKTAIDRLITLQHAPDDSLFSIKDIAAYCETSTASARRMLAQTSAPNPKILPGTGQKRWRAGDIKRWLIR